jgi:hypothetical protein
VLYVAFGAQHLEEARLAALSVRRQMMDVEIALLTDAAGLEHTASQTAPPHVFDRILRAHACHPESFARLVHAEDAPESNRHYYNKILALQQTPFDRTLYLDTDTRMCAPLWELFTTLEAVEIAGAHTPTRFLDVGRRPPWFLPSHNTGVLAYRRNPGLFVEWRRLYVRQYVRDDYSDQSVFDELLWRTKVRHSSLPEEYNYRVSALAKLDGPVKVLHGRDHERLAAAERFVNHTTTVRLVLPEVGMIWIGDDGYEFLNFDDQDSGPILLRRQQLLLRLSHLL